MAIKAGTAFIDVIPNMTTFVTGLQTGMARAANAVGVVGARLTKFVTIPAAIAGGAALKMGSDFEDSMQRIVGLVGRSQAEVDKFSDAILRLAGDVPQAPRELAEALFFVTSAGFESTDAMDVLEASAKAAAAGLGETKVVADAVTSAVNAYGIENLSAAEATDVLVAAVREGKLEADRLAPAIGRVIPLAAEMGVNFNEVGTVLAATSRTGTSAQLATTGLLSVLRTFAKPTKATEDALAEMSLSVEDVTDGMAKPNGLIPTLVMLREKMEEHNVALTDLFPNQRAFLTFADLTGKNLEDNLEIFDAMVDVLGDTDEAFAVASETMRFRFQSALSAIQAALIRVFFIIRPFVSQFLEGFTNLIQKFQELDEATQMMIVRWVAVAAAVGPALLILKQVMLLFAGGWRSAFLFFALIGGMIADNWDRVRPVFDGLVSRLQGVVGEVSGIGPAIRDAAMGAFRGLASFFEDTILPVFERLVEFIGGIVEIIAERWDDITGVFQTAGEIARSAVEVIVAAFDALLDVFNFLKPAIEDIFGVLITLLRFVLNVAKAFLELAKVIVQNKDVFFALALALGAMFLPALLTMLGNIALVVAKFASLAHVAAVILGPGILLAVGKFLLIAAAIFLVIKAVRWVIENWEELPDILGNVVGVLLKIVRGFVRVFFAVITLGLSEAVLWIIRNWDRVKEGTINAFNAVLDFIKAFPGNVIAFLAALPGLLIAWGARLIKGLIEGIENAAEAVWNFFKELPGKILGFVAGFPGLLIGAGVELIKGLANGIKDAAKEVWNFVKDIPGRIAGFLKSGEGTIIPRGVAIIQRLLDGINGKDPDLMAKFEGMLPRILAIMNQLPPALQSVGQNIINGILAGIDARMGAIDAKMFEIGSRVRAGIARATQQSSPSRMTMELGRNITEGLRLGIEEGIHKLANTAFDLGVIAQDEIHHGMEFDTPRFRVPAMETTVLTSPTPRREIHDLKVTNWKEGLFQLVTEFREEIDEELAHRTELKRMRGRR